MLESEMPHGAGSEAIGLVNRRSSIRGHQRQLLALNVCAGTARFPAAIGGIPEGICGTWFALFNIKREVRGK
jgi:hypothetical protein